MSYGKKASHVEPVSTQHAFRSLFNIGFPTAAGVNDGGPSAICSVDSSSNCSRESWHADAGHDDEPGRLIGSASSALHAPQVALDQDHLSEGGEEEECEHDEVLSDEADETVAQVNPPVSKAPLPHLAVSKANLFAKPQAPKTPMAKAIMQKAPMPLAALMKAAVVKAAPMKATMPKAPPTPGNASVQAKATTAAPQAAMPMGAASSSAVVVASPALQPPTPMCGKCMMPVDPLRVQLTGKVTGKWKCNKCNTRHVQLVRIFGGWPPRDFQGLSATDQIEFWRQPAKGPDMLKDLVIDTFAKKRIESRQNTTEGSYLPLGVYARMGYDVGVIQNQCKDTKEDPILGLCYKVKIETSAERTTEELIRSQLVSRKRKRSTSQGKDDGEPAVAEDANKSSNNTTTSSSSSSSDQKKMKSKKKKKSKGKSGRKTSKKSKKDIDGDNIKREAQEAARRDRQAAHEAEKEVRKIHTLCKKAMAKIAPLMFALGQDLEDKYVAHVPKFATSAAQKAHKLLLAIEKELKQKLVSPAPTAPSWTVDSLSANCKEAQEHSALLANLLATARKHATCK